MAEGPTTQRAYTLRLRGDDNGRDVLWTTHLAVNVGARAFGDWLLTMRGGIDHRLAEDKPHRRRFLALSWLNVESAPTSNDSHSDFVVIGTKQQLIDSLRDILIKRGVEGDELKLWIEQCSPSLSAEIRPDAVWVNRSKMFDLAQQRIGDTLTRDEIWDFLDPFFASKDAFFSPVKISTDEEEEEKISEEKAKDLVQKAGGWLSRRVGEGKGANFAQMCKVYTAIAMWAQRPSDAKTVESIVKSLHEFNPASKDKEGILGLISGPGYKSATRNLIAGWSDRSDLEKLRETALADSEKCKANVGGKGHRIWSDAILSDIESKCGFTYLQKDGGARHAEFSVMLDHAARRVSIAHSWIKRADAEREQFQTDAEKIESMSAAARTWLDAHSIGRGSEAASEGIYRIRKRAVGGWKEVLARWSRADGMTRRQLEELASKISPETPDGSSRSIWECARIALARELQDNHEIDKFGDIQLFEALAVEDATVVWRINGKTDPQPLIDYVTATDAIAKRQRFKVPAYRHPDALSHPVFCDFGNSRWDIRFDIHELRKLGSKKRQGSTDRFTCNGLRMKLWNGREFTDEPPLRWQCKRMTNDLQLNAQTNGKPIDVARGDRAGRAAANADVTSSLKIVGLFDQKDWNGRLQIPRRQLNDLAKYLKDNNGKWDAKAELMRRRLHWLVSFSAKLHPQGPWFGYVSQCDESATSKPFIAKSGEYAVKHEANDARKGMAKLILSRLPRLRLLGADLGHRFGAAGSVWQTLTRDELLVEIAGRKILRGGTRADDLHLHTEHLDKANKTHVTIYRRIGNDTLPNGSAHPAAWARLDRQFLIKLQGENKEPRAASRDEKDQVRALEKSVDFVRDEVRDPLVRSIDELMSDAVRTVRLGLRRHADAARIAFRLTQAETRDRRIVSLDELSADEKVEHLTDVLMLWYDLAHSEDWKDEWAKQQWQTHIASIPDFHEPMLPEEEIATSKRQERRKKIRESLKLAAAALVNLDRKSLSDLWKNEWAAREPKWTERLKHLRRWILPRGLAKSAAKRGAARHVGGLSLTRISTIRSLWQVFKAHRYRPLPANTRAGTELIECDTAKGYKFGDRMLQTMERMREQRVKQLASRIIEAALGIGSENKLHWTKNEKTGKRTLRPRQRINDPRFAPCHAIAIENLTNYRPEETRTRRENRQLMNWSASKVKKYLGEGCLLNGLHLREISPAYTSQQDSRTGKPGARCDDVPVKEFLTAPWWHKTLKSARKKFDEKKSGSKEDEFLIAFEKTCRENWQGLSDDQKKHAKPIRLLRKGGDLFVSIDGRVLQADLNAAANIGLRALIDPDWPGRWWYVPCQASTGKPLLEKTKGSLAIPNDLSLTGETPKPDKKEKDVVNLWRDCSSKPLSPGQFKSYVEYWNGVKVLIVQHLRKHNLLEQQRVH